MTTGRISRLNALVSGLSLCFSLSVSTALAATPLPSDDTGSRPVEVLSRGIDGTPRLLVGALSTAMPGADPVAIADRYISDLRRSEPAWVPAELSSGEATPLGNGFVVRYRQQHLGIPVLAGDLVLRISSEGQVVRLARDVVPTDALNKVNPIPSLSVEDAQRAIRAVGPGLVGTPELTIDNPSGRLAYIATKIDLAAVEHAKYLVDAHSGEVFRRIEQLKFLNQFSAYRYNPATAASPEVLAIPSGDTGPFAPMAAAPRPLTSTLLRGLNCIDNMTLRVPAGSTTAIHLCEPMQTNSSATGDYSQFTPLVGTNDGRCPTKNDANKNSFGEAHMYFHTASVYTRFRSLLAGLGMNDFRLAISTGASPKPFPLLTNLCMPNLNNVAQATNPAIPLNPYENAFFSPGDPKGDFSSLILGTSGDLIAFGMGAKANYSMDADVIYHEFTHAVIASLNKLTLSVGQDNLGLNDDPGAMNEGLADFFSSAITGSSAVGEYAKNNFTGLPGPGLRDLDNTLHCTNDRVGEVHEDANPFSGALWRARIAVTGDPLDMSAAAVQKRTSFDQAILKALLGSISAPTMTDMGFLIVDEVGKQAAALGSDAAQKTTDALTMHGILNLCDRVIKVSTAHRMLCLDSDGKKLWPGHAQWRFDLPYSSDTVTFRFTTQPAGAYCNSISSSSVTAAPIFQLAVRSGGQPVTWDRQGIGTYDRLVDVKQGAISNTWTATVSLARGQSHHVMIVNSGGGRIAQNVTVEQSCTAADGCPAPVDSGGSSALNSSGCGCFVGATPGAGSWLGLLPLLGIASTVTIRRLRRRNPSA